MVNVEPAERRVCEWLVDVQLDYRPHQTVIVLDPRNRVDVLSDRSLQDVDKVDRENRWARTIRVRCVGNTNRIFESLSINTGEKPVETCSTRVSVAIERPRLFTGRIFERGAFYIEYGTRRVDPA
jgi:hypothetical protein